MEEKLDLSRRGDGLSLELLRECMVKSISAFEDRVELCLSFDYFREERKDADEEKYSRFKSCLLTVELSPDAGVFASYDTVLNKKGVSRSMSYMRINDLDTVSDFAEMINSGVFIASIYDIMTSRGSVNIVLSVYPQARRFKKYASANMLCECRGIKCEWSE